MMEVGRGTCVEVEGKCSKRPLHRTNNRLLVVLGKADTMRLLAVFFPSMAAGGLLLVVAEMMMAVMIVVIVIMERGSDNDDDHIH